MFWGYFWVLLSISELSRAAELVLSVSHTCGKNTLSGGGIDIISDATLNPTMYCKDGFNKTMGAHDLGHYYADAYFRGNSKSECLFVKKKNSNVYTLKLTIMWSSRGEVLYTNEQDYVITCTYDENGNRISNEHEITRVYAGKENQKNMGVKAQSKIDLTMIDVRGKPVSGPIIMGKIVQLQASIGVKTKGIKVVSCDAVSELGVKHSVLKGGCGDGMIFKLNEGFTTIGNKITSPYFPAFRVNEGKQLSFKCNLTVCQGRCEGSSCVHMKKRAVEGDDATDFVKVVSIPIELKAPVTNHKRLSAHLARHEQQGEERNYLNVGTLVFFMIVLIMLAIVLSTVCTWKPLR